MFSKELLAFAAGISSASATIYQGFNYGSGTDFSTEFALAKSLVGTSGAFTSARLYTTIEENTATTPTSAIPAAISNDVSLLLGLWSSAGQANIDNEIAALQAAISTYGTAFTSLVVGISVGSEDLYRICPTGIENDSGAGAEPSELVSYISQVRTAIAGTGLSGVPVGHVDTWTAWVNSSNDAVISASDFLGMDAYPYFQTTESNSITNAYDLFFSAYDQTVADSQGKPVWVTETGWPASGPSAGEAVPSIANAQTYWDEVACKLLGATNTWWYTLDDAGASPSFGLTTGSSTPLYDLTCSASSSSSSSTTSTASSTASVVASASSSTSVAASTTSAVSLTSSAASLTSAESTATPSNSIVSVTSSVNPSQVGGGSPADTTSIAADSSAASIETASPSAYSSALASASSAVSAASTDSTATIGATSKATASVSGVSATSVVVVGGTTSTAVIGSTTSVVVVGGTTLSSAVGSSSAVAVSSSAVAGVSGTSTSTSPVASYTGGASTLKSTGGFVAAVVALLAAL